MYDAGFEIFDPPHLIWLTVCAVSSAAAFYAAGRLSAKPRKTLSRILAVLVCMFHVAETVFRYLEGTLNIGTLPFHICSVTVYLIVLFELYPDSFAEGALFFPGLPGAVCAVIFPDWTSYPPFSPLSAIGFLSHISIVCYILYKIREGRIIPRFRLAGFSLLFFALYSAVMIPFDNHFGVNYGFLIRPAPGSPLEIIDRLFDFRNGYLIGYAAAMIICVFFWYGLSILVVKIKRILS